MTTTSGGTLRKILLTALCAAAVSCAPGPKPQLPDVSVRQVSETWREINSILSANEDLLTQEVGSMRIVADTFIFDLGDVVNVVNGYGLQAEFAYVWNHPDVDGPEYQACAVRMTGIQSEWENVLLHLPSPGWSAIPPPRPPLLITSADCSVLEGWRFPYMKGLDSATNLPMFFASGQLNMFVKGGAFSQLPFPLPPGGPVTNPLLCPEIRFLPEFVDVAGVAKQMTTYAGNIGGAAEVRGRLYYNAWEFYNVSGRDNLALLSSFFDGSDFLGAWHIGQRNVSWPAAIVPRYAGFNWYDPLDLNVHHANKTSRSILAIPPEWQDDFGGAELFVDAARPGAAFGATAGPSVYAVWPNENAAPGSEVQAAPLVAYPARSNTFAMGYRKAEGDDTGVVLAFVKGNTLAVWYTKCLGTRDFYGIGPPGAPSKGWHGQNSDGSWAAWEVRLLFYDLAELAQVYAGTLQPWEVQPYDYWAPKLFPQGAPIDEGPGVVGCAFDAATSTAYLAMPQTFIPQGMTSHKQGCALVAVRLGR